MWLYSPMLGRDLSFHGYAADCMKEHGSLIIIGKPVDEYPNKTIPWKPKSWTHDRLILKEFKATINILGPNQAKVRWGNRQHISFLSSIVRQHLLSTSFQGPLYLNQ
jgi:hypothetical protein